MDLSADFKSYQEKITSSLVNVTRTAAQISTQDIGFHRSSSDRFSQTLDAQSTHLLRLTNKLLKAASKDTPLRAPLLQNRDSIEDNWRGIVDVVDDLLEKADSSLDEFTGVIKRLSPARQDGPASTAKKARLTQGFDQWSHQNLPKPQLLFNTKVNNFESAPWKPLLSDKPHANMPLEESIGTGEGGFKHPYAHEIQHMIYPSSVYKAAPPIPFSPSEDSAPIWVDTEEAVAEMLTELRTAKEIAVDLEHNDRNSYIGLVCLMQISTREKDWIVDTLKPWRQNLQILNEVFANPRIIKVFHGSTSDIIWLQRDLGLYIVGLFDTYHASNSLQFPAKSLKYLLQRFADFEAQKQYQLADWRVRPLPQELIDYARSDTHFLLYIYDNLRNMLLEESTVRDNLVEHVLDCSRKEALQVYERPTYDKDTGLNPGGWMRLLLQRATNLSNEQVGVFRSIHEWRDSKARELDEGDQNIMPNTYVWTIAENMPTFRGAFNQRGAGRLPRYVAEHIPEIIEVVKQGIAEGKSGPSLYELIEKNSSKAGYMFGRNKYVRKKPEDPNRGVGATLQLLSDSGELATPPSATGNSLGEPTLSEESVAVKATLSQLWGAVQPVSIRHTPNPDIVARALQTVLPLQSYLRKPFESSELFAHQAKVADRIVPTAPIPIANGASLALEKEDIFTLKDRNRKRKASDVSLLSGDPNLLDENELVQSSTPPSPNLSIPDTESATQNQANSKKIRKAEKKAKKAAEAEERAAAQANMVPFDYANAETVLHAKNGAIENGDTPDKKKARDKPMNPFVRALDTSTGARRNRMGKELAGKSHTFKG